MSSDKPTEARLGVAALTDADLARDLATDYADLDLGVICSARFESPRAVGMAAIRRALYAEARCRDLEGDRLAVLNLLARVHRDGGHHTHAVGFVASCANAEGVFVALLARSEALEAAEARCRELEAALRILVSEHDRLGWGDPLRDLVEGVRRLLEGRT